MSNNVFYNLENIQSQMKKEFGDALIMGENDGLTFESLCMSLKKVYKGKGMEFVRATKSECELSLTEMEDNFKNDHSISYTALMLSIFSMAVSSAISFFSIIKDVLSINISTFVLALIWTEFGILIGSFILILILLVNTFKHNYKLKKLNLKRQYLKFKLNCINNCL